MHTKKNIREGEQFCSIFAARRDFFALIWPYPQKMSRSATPMDGTMYINKALVEQDNQVWRKETALFSDVDHSQGKVAATKKKMGALWCWNRLNQEIHLYDLLVLFRTCAQLEKLFAIFGSPSFDVYKSCLGASTRPLKGNI